MNALATALNAAQDVKATRLLTTSHQFPRTPSTFTEDQDKHIKDTVRSRRPVIVRVVLFSMLSQFIRVGAVAACHASMASSRDCVFMKLSS